MRRHVTFRKAVRWRTIGERSAMPLGGRTKAGRSFAKLSLANVSTACRPIRRRTSSSTSTSCTSSLQPSRREGENRYSGNMQERTVLQLMAVYSPQTYARLIQVLFQVIKFSAKRLRLLLLLFVFPNNKGIIFYQLYSRFIGNYLPIIGAIRIIDNLIGTCGLIRSYPKVPFH